MFISNLKTTLIVAVVVSACACSARAQSLDVDLSVEPTSTSALATADIDEDAFFSGGRQPVPAGHTPRHGRSVTTASAPNAIVSNRRRSTSAKRIVFIAKAGGKECSRICDRNQVAALR